MSIATATPLPTGQTQAVGLSLSQRFGIRRASDGLLIKPEEATIIVAGPVDAGKSTFLGSCKTLLRIDIDKTGITLGQVADYAFDRDQPGPTWKQLEDLAAHLIAAKKAGTCPYTTVALDSLTTLLHLAMTTVEAEYVAIHPGQTFLDMGQTGWTLRNRKVLHLINTLRLGGLGVAIVVHLVEKTVPLGPAGSKVEEGLDMSAGVWSDLSPLCDIVCVIKKTTIEGEEPELNAAGQPVMNPLTKKPRMRKTGENRDAVDLTLRVPQTHPWAKFLKAKQNSALTSVADLPIVGGWQKFTEAWAATQKSLLTSLPQTTAPGGESSPS